MIAPDARRVLAHPDDEADARRYADSHGLPLQLEPCVPSGQVFVMDPVAMREPSEPTRVVGICSRCATSVLLTSRGASCACGAMRIPRSFFPVMPVVTAC